MGQGDAADATRSRFASRWGLNLAVLVIGCLVGIQLHGRETFIESYRLDPDGRLIVMTSSGAPGRWNRVADLVERETEVIVTIRTATPPVAMTDIGIPAEIGIPLEAPLGDRVVIDGSRGEPVPRAP